MGSGTIFQLSSHEMSCIGAHRVQSLKHCWDSTHATKETIEGSLYITLSLLTGKHLLNYKHKTYATKSVPKKFLPSTEWATYTS